MPCLLFFSCGDFLRISTGPSHALDPLGSHSLSDSLTAGSLSQEGCSKIRRLSGRIAIKVVEAFEGVVLTGATPRSACSATESGRMRTKQEVRERQVLIKL